MAKVITKKVRLSFVNIFEPKATMPNQEPKYSVTVIVPKSDEVTIRKIYEAIKSAEKEGRNNKWDGKAPAKPVNPVYDGDEPRPNGEAFGPECRGCIVFTASSKIAPEVVDAYMNPVIDKNMVYSGCYGRVSVNFYPYSAAGRKGIACGLNNVQYLCDGERLGSGRSRAEEDFADTENEFAEYRRSFED